MSSETKTAAIITIRNPSAMSDKGRKEIAEWMRKQARFLTKYGNGLGKSYRARYLYLEKDEQDR